MFGSFDIGRDGVDRRHGGQPFDDPANFRHSLDIEGDKACFFLTNRQLLRWRGRRRRSGRRGP